MSWPHMATAQLCFSSTLQKLSTDWSVSWSQVLGSRITLTSFSDTLKKMDCQQRDSGNALNNPMSLYQLGCDPLIQELAQDIHYHTWFKIGDRPVTRTTRGTRPGSPLADIIFHCVMHDIHKDLTDWIADQRTFIDLCAAAGVQPLQVIWSDDLAIPWATDHSEDLHKEVANLLSFVKATFQRRGFKLNLAKNKTSVVATLGREHRLSADVFTLQAVEDMPLSSTMSRSNGFTTFRLTSIWALTTPRKLIDLYTQGCIAATISGSPCETFSAARAQPPPADLDGSIRWPRPLRSYSRLFGLDHLTFKELRQLGCGTAFYLQTAVALTYQLIYGGYAISEHPGEPQDPNLPSIWRTAILQLLMKHPQIRLHRVAQWRWGATVYKPTGLLAVCGTFPSPCTAGRPRGPLHLQKWRSVKTLLELSRRQLIRSTPWIFVAPSRGRFQTNLRGTCVWTPSVYSCLMVLWISGFMKLCKPRQMLRYRPSCQITKGVKFGHLLLARAFTHCANWVQVGCEEETSSALKWKWNFSLILQGGRSGGGGRWKGMIYIDLFHYIDVSVSMEMPRQSPCT